jgi:predicted dinucleotide-binding enzyme
MLRPMVKKKKKSELVLIGTMVPEPHAAALKLMAQNEDRSVSKIVKKLVEDSPQFQEALRQVQTV